MNTSTHNNISIRLPKNHVELIVKAAIEANESLSRYIAKRALASACLELGVAEPPPDAPSRDKIKAAAAAAGMSLEAFVAKAMADAVEAATRRSERPPVMRDSHDTEPPPGPAKPSESGNWNFSKMSPAKVVANALHRTGSER
jgi:uncharacterized protein (DUF1778 family)